MTARPDLVIFDLDGTLIEYELDYVFHQALNRLPELGCGNIDIEVIRHHFSLDQMFGFAPEEERVRLNNLFWDGLDRDNYPPPRTMEGTVETLCFLRKNGVRCAIATSRLEEESSLRKSLGTTGILEFIECLVTRRDPGLDWRIKKPLFEEVCSRCGVEPCCTWAVGDHPSDISSAHEACIPHAVALLSGSIYPEILASESPAAILPGIREIPDYWRHIFLRSL